MFLAGLNLPGAIAVPLTRHPSMFLAGIQCLSNAKTLDACLRRHDELIPDSSARKRESSDFWCIYYSSWIFMSICSLQSFEPYYCSVKNIWLRIMWDSSGSDPVAYTAHLHRQAAYTAYGGCVASVGICRLPCLGPVINRGVGSGPCRLFRIGCTVVVDVLSRR